ncbi:MAG: hypothetical protein AAB074_23285 [Planctomycetota bacterium]
MQSEVAIKDPHAALFALLRGRAAALPAPALLLLAAGCAAAFGAAVGSYTGGMQILYAAVKMPLYFLSTLGISFAALHVLAASRLPAGETLKAASEAVALTAAALGGLAPVVAFVSLSCRRPDQASYTFLILVLTASVAIGGLAGVARLHARIASPGLTVAWVVIYQFTGAQMAWLLKPWVSYTFKADRFLPLHENLHGNFYESIFGVLRSLLS